MEAVWFENELGEKLSATLHVPDQVSGQGMVLGHCFTCSRHTRVLNDLAQALCSRGFFVLRFDFSGNGKSQGDFHRSTYSKQVDEITAAKNYLREQGAEQLFLAGHSMGGTAALISAATKRDILGVVAMGTGPATLSPGRLLDSGQREILDLRGETSFQSRGRSLSVTKDFFEDARQYDLMSLVPEIACPVLLIHGENDEITPPINPESLAPPNPSNVEVFPVPGADHMFSSQESRGLVTGRVLSWLNEILQ